MSNHKNFYREFEDKYRGSRSLIKDRLCIYLPFIEPLKNFYPDGKAFDIGCGRGEWLELLQENEIGAQGIDMDAGMLQASKAQGLDVQEGDGIKMLQEMADESAIIISAFHVIEHISFEQLQTLAQEALRVLKPGGILILETPNPENIKVATENFYLDPTHTKPIPSSLLSFLTEYSGFQRNKIVRLNEYDDLENQHFSNLEQVFEFVSPDYAVIAQKNASTKILSTFNEAFAKKLGLSLTDTVKKFDQRTESMEHILNNADSKADDAMLKAKEVEQWAHEVWQQYHAVTNSTSWKLTKPLRYAGKTVRWFTRGVKAWLTFSPESRPRRVLNKLQFSCNDYISQHPKVEKLILKYTNFRHSDTLLPDDVIELDSPRAKQIYHNLKKSYLKPKE
jgi:O-antigen chain-terminating methyltransferase